MKYEVTKNVKGFENFSPLLKKKCKDLCESLKFVSVLGFES